MISEVGEETFERSIPRLYKRAKEALEYKYEVTPLPTDDISGRLFHISLTDFVTSKNLKFDQNSSLQYSRNTSGV